MTRRSFDFATVPRIVVGPAPRRTSRRWPSGWAPGCSSAPAGDRSGTGALLDAARAARHHRAGHGRADRRRRPRRPTRTAREFAADVVLAIGGGSVLDLGKAVAALVGNGGDPLDYLEVVGAGTAAQPAVAADRSPSRPPPAPAPR